MNVEKRIRKLEADIASKEADISDMRSLIAVEKAMEQQFPGAVTILFDRLAMGLHEIQRFHRLVRFEIINNRLYVSFDDASLEWDEKRRIWYNPDDDEEDGTHLDHFDYA